MAKEPKKRGEKLGEMVGRRRPIIGSVFIFVAFILMVSAFSYAPSQNIFFRAYLESFLPTTEIYGENLCNNIPRGGGVHNTGLHFLAWGSIMAEKGEGNFKARICLRGRRNTAIFNIVRDTSGRG